MVPADRRVPPFAHGSDLRPQMPLAKILSALKANGQNQLGALEFDIPNNPQTRTIASVDLERIYSGFRFYVRQETPFEPCAAVITVPMRFELDPPQSETRMHFTLRLIEREMLVGGVREAAVLVLNRHCRSGASEASHAACRQARRCKLCAALAELHRRVIALLSRASRAAGLASLRIGNDGRMCYRSRRSLGCFLPSSSSRRFFRTGLIPSSRSALPPATFAMSLRADALHAVEETDRIWFGHVERIVGAEHDVIGAPGFDQVLQLGFARTPPCRSEASSDSATAAS